MLGKKACISTSVVRVVCEIYRNEVEEGLKKPAKRLTSDEKLTALLEVYVDTLYSEVCQKYEIRYRCVLSYWIAKYHKGGTFEDWRSVRHTRNIPVHKKDVAPIEKEKTKYVVDRAAYDEQVPQQTYVVDAPAHYTQHML